MGRKKLSFINKVNLFYDWINSNRAVKEFRGIDCEFCRSMDMEKISSNVTLKVNGDKEFKAVYKCKTCGANIIDTQHHSRRIYTNK